MGEDNFTTMGNQAIPSKSKFGINKNLVMLKLTLFFLYGATSSLLPYLTIHMQSIGLTIGEIATIYLALPFTTFLAPPVTGFLVDKFGRYKPVVIISFLLNAAIHHSFLLLPHQELPAVKPPGYVIRHPHKGEVEVWWSPCMMRECPLNEELDVVLDTCVEHCLLRDANLPQNLKNFPQDFSEDLGEEDDLKFHFHKNKKNSSRASGSHAHKKFHGATIKKSFQNLTAILFILDMHPDLADPVEQLGIEIESDEDDDSTDLMQRFGVDFLTESGINVTELEEADLRCGGKVQGGNYTNERIKEWADDCILQKCNFRSGGPEICPPDYKESDDSIFYIYFCLRFVGTIMMTAGVTIMDPIALTMIEKHGGDFGREKLFSSLGMALFSPITGTLIDLSSKRLGYTDYSAAFYAYDVLLVIASITVFLMPLGSKLPSDNIFHDLIKICKMAHILVFIIFLFLLGNLWGFIESFLFFYLKDLGAPNYLLGVTVTVGTVSSMPFLYGAEKITKKFGHVNIIILAFFAHAGRLMGYSFIENAWWCFPFEAMESVSVHLMWVAAATYCASLAPKNLLATLIGVIGMAHFSIGRGSGSFVGGHLIGKVGIRQAFRLMGLGAIISGIVYALLHYYWLRNIKPTEIDEEIIEQGEIEKLKEEPKFKDQSTMVSFERLSLMIEYNQIGSISSLGRKLVEGQDVIKRSHSNSMRRCSYSIGTTRGSASKMDLLRSSIDMNNRSSTPALKNSFNHLNKSFTANKTSTEKMDNPRASQKSLTPVPDDPDLIPNEADEIIYASTKKTTPK